MSKAKKDQEAAGKEPKPCYFEYGTIEGELRDLGVVDVLTGQKIPYYLRDDRLVDVARKAQGHRVRVEGKIKVDRQTSQPLEVEVDDINIMRERSDLPQMEDLHGIDITGGAESSGYIRNLRDDEPC